jgi:hypothetical protein
MFIGNLNGFIVSKQKNDLCKDSFAGSLLRGSLTSSYQSRLVICDSETVSCPRSCPTNIWEMAVFMTEGKHKAM